MRRLCIAMLASALVYGCTGQSDTAVPRRTAYPRILGYDSVYTAVDSLPVVLTANSDARVSVDSRPDGSVWINISYPRYDATVYCTLTPVDATTVDGVIDNRAERIHRNLGSSRPDFIEFDNDHGYYANVVLTPSAASTPVQFMSFAKAAPRWVVSGSVFFDHASADTSLDSIMPMIDVLRRDVVCMLHNLSDR